MGKKGDLSNFECGMVVDARQASLSISQSAQLLGFSRTTISKVYKEWCEKQETSRMRQSCGRKCFVDARGQRRKGRLIQADRRATLSEITTCYNRGMQQSICEATTCTTLRRMCYNSRRPHRVPLILAWSDESRFLLRHSDGRVRICLKQNENMDPYHCAGWFWWCNGVGDVFLAHFRPLSANLALFKCHSPPEHCFWPCPSLYGHLVPILWWLLPAG